ncbi:ATP dependent DNA ligase-like protein [Burkholderiales bacterium JOSHI_001]|nr:ATP dependent DNA ligase-like protein [Burkholderiales bacterium JOSHI_001]
MNPTPPNLTRRHCLSLALGSAAGLLAPPLAAARSSGPALLLAQDADGLPDPAPFLVSEKLDGVRALWTGSQLLSRGGLVLSAPDGFLRGLPAGVALDGELWLGRGRFDATSAAVRRQQPRDPEWRAMQYQVFELPGAPGPFAQRADTLHRMASRATVWQAAPQRRLADAAALKQWLDAVVAAGGEGLMLHAADAPYITGRHAVLQKLKPLHDADAVVLGHQPGRGRLAGQMGALRLRTRHGVEFDLGTGFTDAQRAAPPDVGAVVSYTHRGFTPAGVPRFASFLRVRTDL